MHTQPIFGIMGHENHYVRMAAEVGDTATHEMRIVCQGIGIRFVCTGLHNEEFARMDSLGDTLRMPYGTGLWDDTLRFRFRPTVEGLYLDTFVITNDYEDESDTFYFEGVAGKNLVTGWSAAESSIVFPDTRPGYRSTYELRLDGMVDTSSIYANIQQGDIFLSSAHPTTDVYGQLHPTH